MGSSYLGNAAWAAAHSAGSKIAAMALEMTLSDARAETYAFEDFTLESCLIWTRTLTQPQNSSVVRRLVEIIWPRVYDSERIERAFASLPLRNADRVAVGRHLSWWQDWVEHAEPDDPFWTPIDFSATPASAPPTVTVGGWHDVFLPWQIEDFERAKAAGREAWLTIGPWKHYALAAVGETVRQALPLFQTQLLNAPPQPRSPVRLFVIGAGEWREYDSWPPPGVTPVAYYLAAGGALSTIAPLCGEPSRYDYDPSDPTPSVHGPTMQDEPALGDMAKLECRPDVLLFTGERLQASLDIVGPVWAELFFKSSVEHTDFFLCLCDVDPKTRSTNVCDGYIRVRPNRREPFDGETCRVRIEFWPTAYRYRQGHRIRVIVASGAHPRYARNPGTGDSLADAVTLQVARQQIFHDAAHPSRIVLPIC
jgi:putative CocE/NonD family hydrolase